MTNAEIMRCMYVEIITLNISKLFKIAVLNFSYIKWKNHQTYLMVYSDPSGVRTQDPNIKSVVLYQLS